MAKKQSQTDLLDGSQFEGNEIPYVTADPTEIDDADVVWVNFVTPSTHDPISGISTKNGEDRITSITGQAWNILSKNGTIDTIKDPTILSPVVFLGIEK